MDLKEKIIWITGTNRGIGAVVAQSFARRGAIVVATCRGGASRAKALVSYFEECSPRSIVLAQDVTQSSQADTVAAEIASRFGHLDVLINNAAIDSRVPAGEMTDDQWREVLSTNLDGSWYNIRAALPLLKKASCGKILNVGSITAHTGQEQLAHYEASKLGLVGLTRGLARDLGSEGIRVNCIVLGAVYVEKYEALGSREDILANVNKVQCIPGIITPEMVEPTFAFFASNASDPITGQSLHVDQGWTHN